MESWLELLASISIFGMILSTSALLAKANSKPATKIRAIAKVSLLIGMVMMVSSIIILAIINSVFSPP